MENNPTTTSKQSTIAGPLRRWLIVVSMFCSTEALAIYPDSWCKQKYPATFLMGDVLMYTCTAILEAKPAFGPCAYAGNGQQSFKDKCKAQAAKSLPICGAYTADPEIKAGQIKCRKSYVSKRMPTSELYWLKGMPIF